LCGFLASPSNALDNHSRRHAATGAHRYEAPLQILPLEFIKECADEHGAGRSNRMSVLKVIWVRASWRGSFC